MTLRWTAMANSPELVRFDPLCAGSDVNTSVAVTLLLLASALAFAVRQSSSMDPRVVCGVYRPRLAPPAAGNTCAVQRIELWPALKIQSPHRPRGWRGGGSGAAGVAAKPARAHLQCKPHLKEKLCTNPYFKPTTTACSSMRPSPMICPVARRLQRALWRLSRCAARRRAAVSRAGRAMAGRWSKTIAPRRYGWRKRGVLCDRQQDQAARRC